MLFSRWLARTTKRTLCSPTSTVPHAILPSHEGPSPPPSPRRSVKDVLTTPRKGCHETEHVLLSRAKPRAGRALLSCLCSGGFIPPSSFCCRGAALLRSVWAGVHALTRRCGHQAVCLRFNDCGFAGLAIHAGGSLAGKDSMDASSTMSNASSSEGGSCASFGAGTFFCGL